jgi:hypothetical protein
MRNDSEGDWVLCVWTSGTSGDIKRLRTAGPKLAAAMRETSTVAEPAGGSKLVGDGSTNAEVVAGPLWPKGLEFVMMV